MLNSQGWLLPHKLFSLKNVYHCQLILLILWTDVSLLNVLGCFPSFHNSSKKLCIVLWPSRWEKFNPFCYFWFGQIMTLSLKIKLSPIVWQGTYTIFIHLYYGMLYKRSYLLYSIILIFHSLSFESGFHLHLWQNCPHIKANQY